LFVFLFCWVALNLPGCGWIGPIQKTAVKEVFCTRPKARSKKSKGEKGGSKRKTPNEKKKERHDRIKQERKAKRKGGNRETACLASMRNSKGIKRRASVLSHKWGEGSPGSVA